MRIRIEKKIYIFYIVLVVMACGAMLVTNIGYDSEYQLSMGYRLLKGDAMITEMWEPHQTSAFLIAIFMKLYLAITGTTTGIVLYTQMVGFLIRGTIALLLYKVIKSVADPKAAMVGACLYLLISPKEILTPDFSNMQLWFATLMFLALWQYLKNRKALHLVLAAVCLCLGVLAYPSFVLGYVAAIVILWKYSDTFKRDFLLFTGVCACIGGVYAGYFLLKIDLETFMNCLERALAVEPTHTVSASDKWLAHILNVLKISGTLACIGLMGFIAETVLGVAESRKRKCNLRLSANRWLLLSWYLLMLCFLLNILSAENRGGYAYPMLVMVVLGFRKRKLLSEQERRFYNMAMWIGAMNLLATLLLSDAVFVHGVTYGLLAICASVLPLYHWLKEMVSAGNRKKWIVYGVHLFFILLLFRCIYIHTSISGRGQIHSLASDLALIRSGPAIGIITNEEGAAKQRDSMVEWKEYIQEGDTVWIVAEPVDTLGYLYENVEVGAPSVMSTPTYSEALEYYWELNPDKYPTVVVVASGFGELAWEVKSNQWLMNWLEEYEADTIVDGNYWRYYIKR